MAREPAPTPIIFFGRYLIMAAGAAAGAGLSLYAVPYAALLARPLSEYGMVLAMVATVVLGGYLGLQIARRAIK